MYRITYQEIYEDTYDVPESFAATPEEAIAHLKRQLQSGKAKRPFNRVGTSFIVGEKGEPLLMAIDEMIPDAGEIQHGRELDARKLLAWTDAQYEKFYRTVGGLCRRLQTEQAVTLSAAHIFGVVQGWNPASLEERRGSYPLRTAQTLYLHNSKQVNACGVLLASQLHRKGYQARLRTENLNVFVDICLPGDDFDGKRGICYE